MEIPAEIFLAEEYEVGSVPALLYFKDGQLRERSLGFVHKLIIAENIKKIIRRVQIWDIQVFFLQEQQFMIKKKAFNGYTVFPSAKELCLLI